MRVLDHFPLPSMVPLSFLSVAGGGAPLGGSQRAVSGPIKVQGYALTYLHPIPTPPEPVQDLKEPLCNS